MCSYFCLICLEKCWLAIPITLPLPAAAFGQVTVIKSEMFTMPSSVPNDTYRGGKWTVDQILLHKLVISI